MADRDPRFAPLPAGWRWGSSREPGRATPRRGPARVVHLFPEIAGNETRTLCGRTPAEAVAAARTVFDFLDGTTPSYCVDCGDAAWSRSAG